MWREPLCSVDVSKTVVTVKSQAIINHSFSLIIKTELKEFIISIFFRLYAVLYVSLHKIFYEKCWGASGLLHKWKKLYNSNYVSTLKVIHVIKVRLRDVFNEENRIRCFFYDGVLGR